jgi:hypothetical protein
VTDRVPVLVFDDGTSTSVVTAQRAVRVASSVTLAAAAESRQRTEVVETLHRAGLDLEIVDLPPRTGIRHALELCGERGIHVAYVPHPGAHPGELLRKCVQAAALHAETGPAALGVRLVHPQGVESGPVVQIDPIDTDAGFAALFAARLAVSTGVPLHLLHVGEREVRDGPTGRALEAEREARELILDHHPVLETDLHGDPVAVALQKAAGASAVVVGFGGLTARGRKLTAPDELPDAVLETPDGRLAHQLARDAATDLMVVIDRW